MPEVIIKCSSQWFSTLFFETGIFLPLPPSTRLTGTCHHVKIFLHEFWETRFSCMYGKHTNWAFYSALELLNFIKTKQYYIQNIVSDVNNLNHKQFTNESLCINGKIPRSDLPQRKFFFTETKPNYMRQTGPELVTLLSPLLNYWITNVYCHI